ncbi:TM2 domain-containing protein [Parachryseolinea silvisoli]|jgi:TM2 domain-containing membrane protein YozV|uniref:TM2 domain-containing protein n=1 Tax=Parachryseolinea silvisoli TaxID=2873601 RepID=UPI0022659D3B|nr:TM2 domain-containing protein [Parachryseolinea silvisoli]MCD9014044.1 TM2 domain-containing protein [Parachryseolinea silvisoli]
MDSSKIDMYLMTNAKFFDGNKIPLIRERLLALDESRFAQLHAINLKDPTTILIVSILAGSLGIDRFMIGDTGLGIAKLLTCGGLGIWTIVDWFMIQARTREINFERLLQVV